MAEAKAEAHDRPAWQNPMALHLSEADKAELHMAEAGLPGDENGAPQSLLGGHPGLWLWEEKKKMQKRMDSLRAKLKVNQNNLLKKDVPQLDGSGALWCLARCRCVKSYNCQKRTVKTAE